ncbi:MAG TPA: hypothetical protein VNO14_17690 [Blastocatellia bacterium]|nr:hypothetical protein [Blastocatellia bacterium]
MQAINQFEGDRIWVEQDVILYGYCLHTVARAGDRKERAALSSNRLYRQLEVACQ